MLHTVRALILVLAVSTAAPAVLAQAPATGEGQVRAQGRVVEREAPEIAPLPMTIGVDDPREEMRVFVQEISRFVRRHDKTFILVAQNPLGLIVKADVEDLTAMRPARAFTQAIDGILQEAVWYGIPEIGDKTADTRRDKALERLETARRVAALPVMVLDYVTGNDQLDAVFRAATKRGFMAYPARGKDMALNALPRVPRRPYRESALSVLSLNDARNFVVLRDSSRFGRQDAFALTMHGTNYDVVVVDVFQGTTPLTRQAVETLKYKKSGARRLVLAYLNLGAAESYRYYWQPDWTEGSPSWIREPLPGNPDAHRVEYWNPEWQAIISGNTDSYIYGIIAQGYDGAVLDGLDAYHYYEGGLEADPL